MLKLARILLPIIAMFLALACDRPDCTNTNPVFDQNTPESKEYKDELINELKRADESEITYWLKSYEEKYGREYLIFNVQGDGICAVMEINLTKWDGLEDLREKKGVSYRGAQFTGLEYEVRRTDYETQFIFSGYERIID